MYEHLVWQYQQAELEIRQRQELEALERRQRQEDADQEGRHGQERAQQDLQLLRKYDGAGTAASGENGAAGTGRGGQADSSRGLTSCSVG